MKSFQRFISSCPCACRSVRSAVYGQIQVFWKLWRQCPQLLFLPWISLEITSVSPVCQLLAALFFNVFTVADVWSGSKGLLPLLRMIQRSPNIVALDLSALHLTTKDVLLVLHALHKYAVLLLLGFSIFPHLSYTCSLVCNIPYMLQWLLIFTLMAQVSTTPISFTGK